MTQTLVDLYRVEFNRIHKTSIGNVVTHNTMEDMSILLGNETTVIVGEPYLKPLENYGEGFKKKELIGKKCCWLGSNIAKKVAEKGSSSPYRLVEVDK